MMTMPPDTAIHSSRLYQLLALGFAHPVEEFHQLLAEGSYGQALGATASVAGIEVQALASPPLSFADLEAGYIALFQVGRRGNLGHLLEITGAAAFDPEDPVAAGPWDEVPVHFQLVVAGGGDREICGRGQRIADRHESPASGGRARAPGRRRFCAGCPDARTADRQSAGRC